MWGTMKMKLHGVRMIVTLGTLRVRTTGFFRETAPPCELFLMNGKNFSEKRFKVTRVFFKYRHAKLQYMILFALILLLEADLQPFEKRSQGGRFLGKTR